MPQPPRMTRPTRPIKSRPCSSGSSPNSRSGSSRRSKPSGTPALRGGPDRHGGVPLAACPAGHRAARTGSARRGHRAGMDACPVPGSGAGLACRRGPVDPVRGVPAPAGGPCGGRGQGTGGAHHFRQAKRVPPPLGILPARATPGAAPVLMEQVDRVDAYAIAVGAAGALTTGTSVANATALFGTVIRDPRVITRTLAASELLPRWAVRGLLVAHGMVAVAPDPPGGSNAPDFVAAAFSGPCWPIRQRWVDGSSAARGPDRRLLSGRERGLGPSPRGRVAGAGGVSSEGGPEELGSGPCTWRRDRRRGRRHPAPSPMSRCVTPAPSFGVCP